MWTGIGRHKGGQKCLEVWALKTAVREKPEASHDRSGEKSLDRRGSNSSRGAVVGQDLLSKGVEGADCYAVDV